MRGKQTIAFLLALVLAVSGCCLCVSARETGKPVISLSGQEAGAVAGGTLEIELAVSGNPGICGLHLLLNYDTSVFSLETDEQDTPVCLPGELTRAGTVLCSETAAGCEILWFDALREVTADGTLFTLHLRADELAEVGEYPVAVSCVGKDTVNAAEEQVSFQCTSGTVQVRQFTPMFLGGDVSGYYGQEVSYQFCVQDNPGLAGYRVFLSYDTSAFTPVTAEDSGVVVACAPGWNGGTAIGAVCPEGLSVLWFSNEDVTREGEMFTVRFRISPAAELGEYPVSVTYAAQDTLNAAEQGQVFVCRDGSITVETDNAPRDVNGDGTVDVTDMACLFKYLATGENEGKIQNVSAFRKIADVNGDGEVNILDYQALYEQVRGAS